MEKQDTRTRTEAGWLTEEKEDRECLVQPEFTGLWDRKNSDYTVRTQIVIVMVSYIHLYTDQA